ncbi:MAG: hypothetical protein WAR57_14370 [Candidatus Phosphoribacter sp.]
MGGDYAFPKTGVLRISISSADLVTVNFDGVVVATRQIPGGGFSGRGIAPTVWQTTSQVTMTDITSNVVAVPPVDPNPPPPVIVPPPLPTTPPPPPSTGTGDVSWLSGAASRYATDGSFGQWRGEPVGIAGTWDDNRQEQTNLSSLRFGDMKAWHGPLDDAIGAIWREQGETWAAAAAGAFDARWRQSLRNLSALRAGRGATYVRFAHEMNGDWVPWRVLKGQEADFRAALERFSSIRYEEFPAAKLVLCPNGETSRGMADPRNLFVGAHSGGRPVVDVYCVDTYNQYPHRTNKAEIVASFDDVDANGVPVGIEAHRAFAQRVGVPFSIAEWGNCGLASDCAGNYDRKGEAPAYVEAMNEWMRAHAGDLASPRPGQLIYEIQFNLWRRFALFGPEASQPQTARAYAQMVWGK